VTHCPICDGSTAHHCRKGSFEIRRCTICGHGFVANRPTLAVSVQANADESTRHHLGDFTIESYVRHRDARSLAATAARFARLRGDALDIGSGDGSFSYHLFRRGFRPVMLDLDPRAAQACRHMPGSRFYRETFESFTPGGTFAAIVMSQVLEHAEDPMAWLAKARSLLADGGVLAVALPNFAGIYRLRGASDPFLIPPVHLNFFTPSSLVRAMQKCGLRLLKLHTVSGVSLPGRPGLQRMLNGMLLPLNATRCGIMLRAFATPRPQ
jgi:2-polyprenyl-3-methyl-5-hydroxy-6-metoxy-1,4-benzoquinol methylase